MSNEHHNWKCVDSRPVGDCRYRAYKCLDCGERKKSYEVEVASSGFGYEGKARKMVEFLSDFNSLEIQDKVSLYRIMELMKSKEKLDNE